MTANRVDLPIVARGVCPHDCPDTCSFTTTVVDGVADKITPARDHPVTQGFLCTKVNRYLERTYASDRITQPLRRVGPKGSGQFAAATWTQALSAIAARLTDTVSSFGGESVLPYSYAGTMGLIQREAMSARFFHRLGASQLDRTICSSAGMTAWAHTYGYCDGPGADEIGDNKLIVLWGTNTLTSNPHLWPKIRQARDHGARLVCVDPIRTRTAQASDEHIALRPGTDAALALGMMHVLFRDNLADLAFLAERTYGWEAMRDNVLSEWPTSRSAEICDVSEQVIEDLATQYGTTQQSFIRLNFGMQRHRGGGSAVRAVALLPAVTGAWRQTGSGATLSTSGAYHYDKVTLQRASWPPSSTRTINMNQLADALTEPDAGVGGPPVKALIVYNANPATVAPDAQRVHSGLARDDLFTVVLEHFLTDTAKYADWILPATTQLEHLDVHAAYGHHFASINEPAIAPVGDSQSNSQIFRMLAAAMGYTDTEFADTDEDLLRQALGEQNPLMPGITVESLLEHGWQRVAPAGRTHYTHGRLPTLSGLIQCQADELTELGLPSLPDFVPPATFGIATNQEKNLADRQFILLTPPEHEFLNSTFVNIPRLAKAAGRQTLLMHTADAQALGVIDGKDVRVWNDRGDFLAMACISDDTRPGTVCAHGLRWATGSGPGVNSVTDGALTDLGRGATFYDTVVAVTPL
ncbi:MAG: molybdopterin-dependent oxidoreductase [Candidatus Nanopelagicales bacterium]